MIFLWVVAGNFLGRNYIDRYKKKSHPISSNDSLKEERVEMDSGGSAWEL